MPVVPLIIQRAAGTGNMDAVAGLGGQTETTNARVARFGLPGTPQLARYALVFARVHFGGAATGTDTLWLKRDSRHGPSWDSTLRYWTTAGIESVEGDADLNLRIPEEELPHWTFECGDELVFEWANPGTIPWGIEVGLRPLPDGA